MPDWLATVWGLRQFGTRRTQAHARYAQFVHDGQDQPGIWHGLRNQIYIGDEPFVAWMPSQIKDAKSLDEMPKVQRHLCCLALQAFPRECGNQQAAMAAAYSSGAHTMQAITAYFGVHYSLTS